ncbi:MAG: Gfo/Idh/MocA family oxidoreductase [Propionibacteriales bacterium]|nr:Gfo/Idh/MocA family oxidoreductase [Propionibacteriales bacterium]
MSMRVGLVGAGVISKTYLENLTTFPDVTVTAIGDLRPEAAGERAAEFGIARHGSVAEVLDNPEVDLVVNLTTPAAHADVARAAVAAGKHVWNEKPLTMDLASARALLDEAAVAGVRVGCAPDTVLGAGWQEVRRIIERGDIGQPLTALTLFQSPGPDLWHPNPDFLFAAGGGPLLDIAPYYFTALIQLFGPVATVSGVGSKAHERRRIVEGPRAGEMFDVTVPTHVGALLGFTDGGVAQSLFSFDSAVQRAQVEISGTEGTMLTSDPNQFDGEIKIIRPGGEYEIVANPAKKATRGTGVLDMVRSIAAGVDHRATGALAYHVLEVMLAIEQNLGKPGVSIASTVEKPDPLPTGWDPHTSS